MGKKLIKESYKKLNILSLLRLVLGLTWNICDIIKTTIFKRTVVIGVRTIALRGKFRPSLGLGFGSRLGLVLSLGGNQTISHRLGLGFCF